MKIFYQSENIPQQFYHGCYAIGNFDGIHKGHRYILQHLKHKSRQKNKPFGIITFAPHPKQYFNPKKEFFLLAPYPQKYQMLEDIGVDIIIELTFDQKLQEKNAEQFIEDILLENLKISYLVTGKNFRFGKKRHGNIQTLQKYAQKHQFELENLELENLELENLNNTKIPYNSTTIRKLLQEGNVEKAAHDLDRYFSYKNIVVRGKQLGRKIGFPTANIIIEKQRAVKNGIYATYIKIKNQKFNAVSYLGKQNTIGENYQSFETHILQGFNQDIYGEEIEVEICKFVRPDAYIDNQEQLINQINRDIENTEDILANIKKYNKVKVTI